MFLSLAGWPIGKDWYYPSRDLGIKSVVLKRRHLLTMSVLSLILKVYLLVWLGESTVIRSDDFFFILYLDAMWQSCGRVCLTMTPAADLATIQMSLIILSILCKVTSLERKKKGPIIILNLKFPNSFEIGQQHNKGYQAPGMVLISSL